MSYTSIYKVPEAGEIEEIAEIRNAWRGAMNVWVQLYAKYIRPDAIYMTEIIGGEVMANPKRVWELAEDSRVSETDKIVLMTTFDNVMVKKSNIAKVIEAFHNWNVPDKGSIPEQAQVLESLLDDESCFAVCWRQTSVTDAWNIYEDDDVRMYDVARDTGHWFLFSELN